MHEVIAQLTAYARTTWNRRWYIVVTAWLLAIGGWIWVYTLPDRYEASARVNVDTQSILKPLMSGLAVQPNVDQQIALMTRTLLSRPNMEKVARMTDLDINAKTEGQSEKIIDDLQSNIRITPGGENLFTISYQNSNPQLATRVVESLLTIFVEGSLGHKRKDTDSARKFIEEQLKAYEQKLVLAENSLKDFKRKYVGLMPGQGGGYFERLAQARQAVEDARLELRESENRRNELKRQLAGEEPVMLDDEAGSNPQIDARINNLKEQLDNLLLKFTEQHPDIVATKRVIAQLEEQKKTEAKLMKPGTGGARGKNSVYQQLTVALAEEEANVASLRARVGEFEARYAQLRSAVDAVPQVEAEYTQLNRDYQVNKANYEALLARRESAMISEEMESKTAALDFRIIDPPRVPLSPAWPNRPLMITLVLLGAIAAGIVLAFLISQIRRTVDDRITLKDLTGLPLLGAVSMVWTPEQKARQRKRLVTYIASATSLLGAYAVLLIVTLGGDALSGMWRDFLL